MQYSNILDSKNSINMIDLITKYVLSGSRWENERHRRDKDGPSNRAQQSVFQTIVRRSSRLGRRTSHGEDLEQSRLAVPKNLIRPLLLQDHKSERFRRPALSFAGAHRCSGCSKL